MDLTSRKLRVEDFQPSGRFGDIQIPYHPPVPLDIMLYKFHCSESNRFTHADTLRFLQHLHELKGTRTEICRDCQQHLVNCGQYQSEEVDSVKLQSEPDLTTITEDGKGCECDVQ